jgi:type II secretory pathway pseudopilin PulG
MLVVIGIILVVIGLAAPAIMRAWRAGDRAATYNDLQVIAAGLEAYRTDHGDYPRVTVPWSGTPTAPTDYNGARMLCRALVGPGAAGPPPTPGTPPPPSGSKIYDGKGADDSNPTVPGPGFRLRSGQGRVYGPYIPVDRFKMGDPTTPPKSNPDPGYLALLDRYGKPILYYPATGKPNIHKLLDSNKPSFVGDYASGGSQDAALYNARDNFLAMPLKTFQIMMGDGRNPDPSKGITAVPPNGHIDGDEQAAFEGPFLLWSSGPDEVFGSTTASLDKTDDITNFRK